jgi:hypothetical protein
MYFKILLLKWYNVVKLDTYLLNTIEIKKDLKVKLSKPSENYQIILNAYLDSAFSKVMAAILL